MSKFQLVSAQILPSGEQADDGYKNITKKFGFLGGAGATLADLLVDERYPQRFSVLDENSAFWLRSSGAEQMGDNPPMFEVSAQYTTRYETVSGLNGGYNSETKPWELPVDDFRSDWVEYQEPFDWAYGGGRATSANGGRFPVETVRQTRVVNSARCRILTNSNLYYLAMSFSYNTKQEIKNNNSGRAVINKDAITILGETYAAQTLQMKPVGKQRLITYSGSGKVKWDYWKNFVTIWYKPDGWARELLDIGTMAIFENDYPEQIYKYILTENFKIENESMVYPDPSKPPKYGSYSMAFREYEKYQKQYGRETKYNKRLADFPIERCSDPLPLTPEGKVDTAAMLNQLQYGRLWYWDMPIISWNNYNLPKKVATTGAVGQNWWV